MYTGKLPIDTAGRGYGFSTRASLGRKVDEAPRTSTSWLAGLSYLGPVVCRAPVRTGSGAGRGVAADRLRCADLRAVATPLADGPGAGSRWSAPAARLGSGARGDERLLLRGDQPAALGHGRRDRVLARRRARRAGGADAAQPRGPRPRRVRGLSTDRRQARVPAAGDRVCVRQRDSVRRLHRAGRSRRQTPPPVVRSKD